MDFKKEQRAKEVEQIEKTLKSVKQQRVDIKAIESIEAKPAAFSSKVSLSQDDFKTLMTAAKKFVVQEKKERKLEKLLKVANETIVKLKTQIVELVKELTGYRSVRNQLDISSLQKENAELRQQNNSFKAFIAQQGGFSDLSKNKKELRSREAK